VPHQVTFAWSMMGRAARHGPFHDRGGFCALFGKNPPRSWKSSIRPGRKPDYGQALLAVIRHQVVPGRGQGRRTHGPFGQTYLDPALVLRFVGFTRITCCITMRKDR
jgi:hypothetical protein